MMSNKDIRPMDLYTISANDSLAMWEFKPKKKGLSAYSVEYSECDNEEDAWIALWKALKLKQKG